MLFLRAESDVEMEFLRRISEKAIKFKEIQNKNLAAQIINYLGQAFGAKSTSRTRTQTTTK